MNVLLTGVTGFIGQTTLPLLLNEFQDFNFLTLNNNLEKANLLYPQNEFANLYNTSSFDFDRVEKFNPDIVIHLATYSTSLNETSVIKKIVQTNIEYGVLLLDVLKRCSNFKLFVNTGSFAEYRQGPDKFNSAYLYSTSKTAFRLFLEFFSETCGFNFITAVPYSVYGASMTSKRLMDFIKESMNSEVPVEMTAGEQILDFIHVKDIANFYFHILKNIDLFRNQKNGEEFHLGTGIGTSIRDLVILHEKIYDKKCNIDWGKLNYRKMDIMYAVAPIKKNIELVGWQSKISLIDGI
jgi:CDP-paratose synthetase